MFRDFGPNPLIIDIDSVTVENTNYRTTVWTGNYLQLTVMSIPVGGEVGLEIHPDTDQFIRVEKGNAVVTLGFSREDIECEYEICDGYAVLVPAGTWHNFINTGRCPLKIYTLYAPPHHPHGTIHMTKADSDAEEA